MRSNKERALSRGDHIDDEVAECWSTPIASARPATSAPAMVASCAGVRQIIPGGNQQACNMDVDIEKYLHPNGLFEYIHDKYPQLVSCMTLHLIILCVGRYTDFFC